jgi:hypothetical protein
MNQNERRFDAGNLSRWAIVSRLPADYCCGPSSTAQPRHLTKKIAAERARSHDRPMVEQKKGRKKPVKPKPSKRKPGERRGAVKQPPRTIDDTLTMQEEALVELYLYYRFDLPRAAERAGYSLNYAQKKMKEAHIVAALERRRTEMRAQARMTREELLAIIETRLRSRAIEDRDLAKLAVVWAKLTGLLDRQALPPPDARGDEVSAGAFRMLGDDDVIRKINQRAVIAGTRAKVIDAVPVQRPAATEKAE